MTEQLINTLDHVHRTVNVGDRPVSDTGCTSPLVGFENHLNYFHAGGKGMPEQMAKGLALYLNASLFDCHFRLFSGHTQVNATDLRKMTYPSRDQLMRLGLHVQDRMPDQETIDKILERECEKP